MGGKGSFAILLVIVAVLTLALAVMASYLFFVAGSPGGSNNSGQSSAEHEPARVPAADLSSKVLFEEKKFFNLKSEDGKTSVIQVGAEIEYFKKVDGIKNVEEKITGSLSKMKETIGTYFQNMTLEQAKDPGTKELAKKELVKKLNDLLSSDEKKHYDIIYDITFEDWFYQ